MFLALAIFELCISKISEWNTEQSCIFFHVCDSEMTEPVLLQFPEKFTFGVKPSMENFNPKRVGLSYK